MKLRDEIAVYKPFNEQEKVDQEVILECMDVYSDVLTRENRIAHFTASCWIVNKERTKVLMAHHNIMDDWAWTGGHADGNDDLLKVAFREAKEETGLKHLNLLSNGIYSIEVLHVTQHHKRGKFVNAHVHLNVSYLFEADEEESLQIKEDENSGVCWVDILKVCDLVKEPSDKILYKKLNDKLKFINQDDLAN